MNNDQPSEHSAISIVEDRIRRAFAGEDIGPAIGPTYGECFPPPTEEQTRMAIARINYERGRDHEREACALLAGSKHDHCDCPISVADIIADAIRARSQEPVR